MGRCAYREARPPADLQRCRCPDLSQFEGAVPLGVAPGQVPGCASLWTCRLMTAPMITRRRKDRSPIFVVAPRRRLPPVECCRGIRPSQAAKSWPLRNVSGGGTRTAIAVAISGLMPGTVMSLRATSFFVARRAISGVELCNLRVELGQRSDQNF